MIPFHPLADIFPLIEGEDFDQLVSDIRDNGLREPIILLERRILDGRNRYRACVAAGLISDSLDTLTAPMLKYFRHHVPAGQPSPSHDELLSFVLSKNLHRRHLDESQRAMVAARLSNLERGGDRKSDQTANLQFETLAAPVSRAHAAELLNVSERAVNTAKDVQRDAAPEIVDAVNRGHLSVSAAADIASLSPLRQADIVAILPRTAEGKLTPEVRKALAPVIKEVRAEKQREKGEKRDAREAELGRKLKEMAEKHYGVVLEDFEWDHEPWSRETGMDRHPSNHYPTSSDAHSPEEIVARTAERFKCAADICVLYMWTTIPHEAIAHKVLELRGFTYKSQRVWDKVRPGKGRGPGYWVTGEHEILLIATRGDVVAPTNAHFPSRFEAPVGAHSEKPSPQQYEHAEFHFPSLPKIELNARRARDGWDCWGFEAPSQQPSPGNDSTEDAAA